MAYDPSIFNISPYYDDFDAVKGFLRVLFKPGYALQARELTQAQSILQDQISKVGDHLFKDGSRIVGGGIFARTCSFVMVFSGVGTSIEGVTDYSGFVGATLYNGSTPDNSTVRAKVVHYVNPDTTDQKLVLVVDFIYGTAFAGTSCNLLMPDGTTVYTLQLSAESWGAGNCKLITVSDGIFYIDGFFVRNQEQKFSPFVQEAAYRDFSCGTDFAALNKKIGFTIVRDSVTDQEDSTLRDPAIGSYNYNAPGADRYKINPTLSQIGLDDSVENFVELIRFEGGSITKRSDRITYGEIEKTLARRTYDESGSYTVRPFEIDIKANPSDSTVLNAVVGSGKAYVFGHELESQYPQTLSISKGRSEQEEGVVAGVDTGVDFNFNVGNVVGVTLGTELGPTFANNLATINGGSARIVFRNAAGTEVASGFVHGAIPNNSSAVGLNGNAYDLYLYGISYSGNGSIGLGLTGTIFRHSDNAVLGTVRTKGTISAATDQSLVFDIKPGYAVGNLRTLSYYSKATSNLLGLASVSGDAGWTYDSGTGVLTVNVTKNEFSGVLSAGSSSVFSFLPYSVTGSSDAGDLGDIQIVNASGKSLSLGSSNSSIVTGNGTSSQVTMRVSLANTGSDFTGGNLRVVMPIRYSQSDLATNTSYYRTKALSTVTSETVSIGAISARREENGKTVFLLKNIDIYAIDSVIHNRGAVQTDVKDYFELDDGQREAYYTYGRLVVKNNYKSTVDAWLSTDYLTVGYKHFTSSGLESAPFIGKLSYTDIPYENIPLFTNPRTGKTISLANCLDFRHYGQTADAFGLKPYGTREFSATNALTNISYSHYLPRIDKICVRTNPNDNSAEFFVVEGTPDLSPVSPPDVDDALTLCTLSIPAWTHNPNDVLVTPVDTTRFTMADIGKIQKRVDDVEVFAKLSLSESQIESRSLKASSSETVEPLKTSIFVDEFFGHSVSDVSSDLNICSVDYEYGELRPFFTESALGLATTTLPAGGTTLTSDGLVMLHYSGATYINNSVFTKTLKVNPSNTINWLGFASLSRTVNPLYDTAYRPVVKTNSLMENDNWLSSNANNARGFGTQWNSWESLWTGIPQILEEQDTIQQKNLEFPRVSSSSVIPNINSGNARIGANRDVTGINEITSDQIRQFRMKNRIKINVGNRVVDRSVLFYTPSATVTLTAYGMKPNATGLSVYFDGEVLKTGVTTDSNGTCQTSISIPAGSYLSGERVIRISDSATIENATTSADVVYYNSGLVVQRDSGSYSTRPPVLRRRTVSSEGIVKDPFNADLAYDGLENSQWADPLAQTFFVDRKTNPEGVFLKSVSLFFSSKDSVLPVTVQIRPTVNGYPSPSVSLPFSTVTKMPSAVNANATTPQKTVFTFSSPVFLEPGEYAICVIANSDEYSLFAADSSFNGTDNGEGVTVRAGNNQQVGTLYLPQSIGTALIDNNTDLMFVVERCSFVNSSTFTVTATGTGNKQVVKVCASELIPSGCTITRTIAGTRFINNENYYPRTALQPSSAVVYSLTRGANTSVSPVVDTQTLFGVGVQMRVTSADPSAYISRVVNLDPSTSSNGVQVFLNANLPSGSKIRAYYRYSEAGEADIYSKAWIPLTQASSAFTSTSEFDFREVIFRNTPTAVPATGFNSYQIKVEMWSDSGSSATYFKTPAIRNIRTVSFIK